MRISVSDIETYRRYKANEEVTLEETLAQLRKERPQSPAMLAGSAFHKALETASYSDEYAIDIKCDGYEFYFGGCDVDLQVPPVRELKGEVEIDTQFGKVTLVGVVDAMDTAIYDYKLTGGFDAERLMDSYQWRCYLVMFGADKFVYRVFVGKQDHAEQPLLNEPIAWTINEYHELPVYRYPCIEADVQRAVEEYAAFSRQYLTKAA